LSNCIKHFTSSIGVAIVETINPAKAPLLNPFQNPRHSAPLKTL